jgi:hypothetical protein
MAADPGSLGCAEFQDQLPELISAGETVFLHPQLQSCEMCRALIIDLEMIAEASRGKGRNEGGGPG